MPLAIGLFFQSKFEQALQHYHLPSGMVLKVGRLHQGWMHTDADVEVLVKSRSMQKRYQNAQHYASARETKPLAFTMKVRIDHGPLLRLREFADSSQFRLGLARVYGEVMPSSDSQHFIKMLVGGSQPILKFETLIKFDSKVITTVRGPRLDFVFRKKKEHLLWQGLTGLLREDNSKGLYNEEVTFLGLQYTYSPFSMKLDNASLSKQLKKGRDNLWVGRANYDVPGLSVTMSEKPVFSMSGLNFNSRSQIQDNAYKYVAKATLSDIETEEVKYGPISYEMILDNIDANVISEFEAWIKEAKNEKHSDENFQGKLFSFLPRALNHGAKLSIPSFDIKLPQGQLKMYAQVDLPRVEQNVPDVLDLVAGANGMLEAQVPTIIVTDVAHEIVLAQRKRLETAEREHALMASLNKARAHGTYVSKQLPSAADNAASVQRAIAVTKIPLQQAIKEHVERWERQRVIVRNGENYNFRIEFKNQQLWLNGAPLTDEQKAFLSAFTGGKDSKMLSQFTSFPVKVNTNKQRRLLVREMMRDHNSVPRRHYITQ